MWLMSSKMRSGNVLRAEGRMTSKRDDLGRLADELKYALWADKVHRYNAALAIGELDLLAGRVGLRATAMAIDELVRLLRDRGNSDATINRKLSFFRALIKGAYQRGYIGQLLPVRRLPEVVGRKAILASTDIDRALLALSDIHRHSCRLATFLADTGATLGEATSVRWTDITHRHVSFWSKKKLKRAVPLTKRAFLSVAFDPSVPDGPFCTIKVKEFRQHWRAAQIVSGLDRVVSPSALRYSCEARLVQAGVDLQTVQQWLGYSTARTAMRFQGDADLHKAKRALERGHAATASSNEIPVPPAASASIKDGSTRADSRSD